MSVVTLLLSFLIILDSCQKEMASPNGATDELIDTRAPVKECIDKVVEYCATGATEAEAKANMGVKARIDCFGFCNGQDCSGENKQCLLTGVKVDKKSITVKLIPGGPDEEDLYEACAKFKCDCKCGGCEGKKQVGNTFTAMHINPAQALADATQMAQAWCASTGCPGIQTCKTGKECKSKGGGIVQKVKEVKDPMPPFLTTVTVLLTECNCKCGAAGG